MASKPIETILVKTEEGSENKKISNLYDSDVSYSDIGTYDPSEIAGSAGSGTSANNNSNNGLSKVIYIPSHEGNIASYNPDYIVRQEFNSDPYKIYLPSTSGILALTQDISSFSSDVYTDIYEITGDVQNIASAYETLNNNVEELSGKVDGYISIVTLREALEIAVSSDVPETNYTIDDILKSHNKLLQALRDLIKE